MADWLGRLAAWEKRAEHRLPLTALRERLGLTAMAVAELFMLGLPDEDPRFGALFQHAAGYRRDNPEDRARGRRELGVLMDAGVVSALVRPAPVYCAGIRRDY